MGTGATSDCELLIVAERKQSQKESVSNCTVANHGMATTAIKIAMMAYLIPKRDFLSTPSLSGQACTWSEWPAKKHGPDLCLPNCTIFLHNLKPGWSSYVGSTYRTRTHIHRHTRCTHTHTRGTHTQAHTHARTRRHAPKHARSRAQTHTNTNTNTRALRMMAPWWYSLSSPCVTTCVCVRAGARRLAGDAVDDRRGWWRAF